MTYTENYALNQWAKTDRIQMSDFNADNAKIDAALKANADTLTTLAGTIPKISFGTYSVPSAQVGQPYHVELGFRPKIVLIWQNCNVSYSTDAAHMNRVLFFDGTPVTGKVNGADCTFAEVDDTGFTVCAHNTSSQTYFPLIGQASPRAYLAIG